MSVVPASREVLDHHVADHERWCPLDAWSAVWCPCGACFALVCASCDEPVLVALNPLLPACAHARDLLDRGAA